ncbi:hypothetical protein M8C21_010928 [Ambrosia artemisiifolia]|uniref:F-box domain-containing protein n=1 Tax=Ambrosia artemisiifolia TaxID=4212 RepID=A0AAD5G280_AMBAR|nr:hypothetical protein M8C21_010928 [Ambrosia artemisiifolia]
MDKLPHPLLLEILSRLDNSADVARCRVASKAFDDVSPYLRSINLRYSSKWFWDPSRCSEKIFLDLISKQETVESVIILLTCHLFFYYNPPPFTLITPNLISLRIESFRPATIHVEAPTLSHFHLRLNAPQHGSALTAEKFEKLKTLWLRSLDIGSLLSKFPITETVENLTLDTPTDAIDSKLTLRKVFMIFPNVSSLRIESSVWSGLEGCLNPEGWEILDGRKGLKTICAYLMLVDLSLTFSFVAFVLDQCEGLTEVSLLIHSGVVGTKSNNFMSKCMARWPGLKFAMGGMA